MNQQFITQNAIDALDIDLSGEDIESLLTHLNDTLQERVGVEITEALSDEQLKTLLDMQDSASEEELGTWLETNVPDMKQIVQDEIDIILGELADSRDQLKTTEA